MVGKNLQPYEAHVPFLLQLKIDLNLAGMGWLHLSQVHILSCTTEYTVLVHKTSKALHLPEPATLSSNVRAP